MNTNTAPTEANLTSHVVRHVNQVIALTEPITTGFAILVNPGQTAFVVTIPDNPKAVLLAKKAYEYAGYSPTIAGENRVSMEIPAEEAGTTERERIRAALLAKKANGETLDSDMQRILDHIQTNYPLPEEPTYPVQSLAKALVLPPVHSTTDPADVVVLDFDAPDSVHEHVDAIVEALVGAGMNAEIDVQDYSVFVELCCWRDGRKAEEILNAAGYEYINHPSDSADYLEVLLPEPERVEVEPLLERLADISLLVQKATYCPEHQNLRGVGGLMDVARCVGCQTRKQELTAVSDAVHALFDEVDPDIEIIGED